MKIKDLTKFHAFKNADFVDFKTYEKLIDKEKEIEDIYSIEINEKVEYMGIENKYFVSHYWLTVYLILKEEP